MMGHSPAVETAATETAAAAWVSDGEIMAKLRACGPRVLQAWGAPDMWLPTKRDVQEEVASGNLFNEVVGRYEAVSFNTKVQLLADLLQGLDAMQKAGIVHCDISPRNLYVFGNCTSSDGCRLKIGGLSACSPTDRGCPAHGKEGEAHYLPPEARREGSSSVVATQETWAAGVIFYQMLFGIIPPSRHVPSEEDSSGKASVFKDDINTRWVYERMPELSKIMTRLLAPFPEARYTASEALEDLRRFAKNRGIPILDDLQDHGAGR
mmetsp:Transcript_77730/g.215370  ORF Transcript_77730/g.215370 Transcript_77730/m.215370 type:complete len:265 (-) Transcript_77730:377-1171(-)